MKINIRDLLSLIENSSLSYELKWFNKIITLESKEHVIKFFGNISISGIQIISRVKVVLFIDDNFFGE